MSLNFIEMKERFAAQYPDMQQVEDSIIRFTKRAHQKPYAVYYLDFTKDLPGTEEKLSKYQDRIIGRYYFEGRPSLQWSNYLYFITNQELLTKNEVRQAKELIERDRSYARKFVITEEEVDSILSPLAVVAPDTAPHTSIYSIWVDRLVNAGIDRAILSDDNMPARIKLIESSISETKKRLQPISQKLKIKTTPFIKSLELINYLDFPQQRRFDFGTVNLIFGPNGSGKTSLLEAIELFYCGRNKRNANSPIPYKLSVELVDGQIEQATDNRIASKFRNFNLLWYGQTEIKTNNLYQSFARFNFLDTDATVSLTELTSCLEDDLSKLLVGSDAAKTWDNIKRVSDALFIELRGLKQQKQSIEGEITTLEKQIEFNGKIKHESDSFRIRLDDIMRRIGWPVIKSDKTTFSSTLAEPLAEMVTVAQQAIALKWLESPVTLNGLAKYCHDAKSIIKIVEPDISHLEELRRNQKHLNELIKRDRETLAMLQQADRLIETGVASLVEEQSKLQKIISSHTGWLTGLDDINIDLIAVEDRDNSLAKYHRAILQTRSEAENLLIKQKSGYKKFSEAQDRHLGLAQELRQIADKLLKISPKADECPLCHTQFKVGELSKHMTVGVDQHLETLGQSFLSQMKEQEEAVRKAVAVESVITWLMNYCENTGLAQNITVREVLFAVEKAKQTLATSNSQLKKLSRDLESLASQGVSVEIMEEVSMRLRDIGYPLAEFTREASSQLQSVIKQNMATLLQTLEDDNCNIHTLQEKVILTLSSIATTTDAFEELSQLKERLASTEPLKKSLSMFASTFPWSDKKPLAELLVEVEVIRQLAAKLQTALDREKQADVNLADSEKRKKQLEQKLFKLDERQKKLNDSFVVLNNMIKNDSLESAMKSALQENRAGIETVFSRIHSPAEFKGIGSDWTSLIRKDGKESSLSQISTGQRTAFALSIFLSQNAQLGKQAPPVILIDDPIAHIDDLNCLSFLDYLRDLVLTNQRQIYFATANDKLATLFERKFDFLGEKDFRRYNLGREK
ncbi:MAG: AAA family ATPase [Syntrophorhabdaceae bacterium]|nr:AAA family ATPase [Syntrophorhabdaceae bacterium]MDD5242643.1 AAA family ATPase [Syntrophorhabdaceae bacterium]